MGHIRVGRLPKTKSWTKVFDVLDGAAVSPAQLSDAVLGAAQKEFQTLKGDSKLTYCFWVLTRILTASRSSDFTGELSRLGVDVRDTASGVDFIRRISLAVGDELRRMGSPTVFSRFAELSLRETLSRRVADETESLFGTGIDEIQAACRKLSTRTQFGRIGRDYFTDFMTRSLAYIVDKELPNHVGPSAAIRSPDDAVTFHEALRLHCYESAKIVEDFSGGWMSKHNWESNNEISLRETRGFVAFAVEKLQMQLVEDRG